ncbi:glycosyltransferase family 2 protein [Isoptericola croceus]|uniref:glycosyltransferase family 2 protein n=1 Tax=Isoptericola croceus TaxID=3031406 RepID=UPI0023F9DAB1|nr:glycosyltransferase [Isoptericola croceus]
MSAAEVLVVVRGGLEWLLALGAAPVLVYFTVVNTFSLLIIVLAALELRMQQHRDSAEVASHVGELIPGVSVIVPAHNEQAGVVQAVKALLTLRYPRHEVVVVDDGSTDQTLQCLVDAFDLVPVPRAVPQDVPVEAVVRQVLVPRDGRTRLVVVSKDNSGKTEAVNTGINAATETLVAIIDADSVLEPDALLRVARPFSDDPIRMVASGGSVRAANGSRIVDGRVVRVQLSRRWLPRIQVVEYFRAFLLGRAGWSRLGCLILISGAFGLFRRDLVVEVGGLNNSSIGEDFELVLRLHRHLRDQGRDYRLGFVAEPVAWTEVPESLAVLRRQRRRWHRGLWETLSAYRGMLLRPRYGRVGFLALPYYWVFELFAPLLEALGLIMLAAGLALGVIDVEFALLFLLLAYGYAAFVTLCALAVEEWGFHRHERWRDLPLIMAASVLENIGYRQLTVWWRLEGWWASLRGKKQVWGVMTRTGFDGGATRAGRDRAAR